MTLSRHSTPGSSDQTHNFLTPAHSWASFHHLAGHSAPGFAVESSMAPLLRKKMGGKQKPLNASRPNCVRKRNSIPVGKWIIP
jgi:hypothetical protein